MILEETFTLGNGVNIPKLGFGTWMIPDEAARVVRDAAAIGYRHFDTPRHMRTNAALAKVCAPAAFPAIRFS